MLHEATVIKETLFLRLQAYLVKNQPIASKYHVRKESKVLIELETVARYNPAALISLAGVHHPTKGGKKRRDEKGKVKKKRRRKRTQRRERRDTKAEANNATSVIKTRWNTSVNAINLTISYSLPLSFFSTRPDPSPDISFSFPLIRRSELAPSRRPTIYFIIW